MTRFNAIVVNDLKKFFYSPSSYLLAAGMSFLCGYFFYSLLLSYLELSQKSSGLEESVDPIVLLVYKLFGNINFLLVFIIPLIASRCISVERKNGTLSLIELSGLPLIQIVFAKYVALIAMGVFLILPALIFPVILYLSGIYETIFISFGLLAVFFQLLIYLAWGVFFSTLSQQPLICSFLHLLFLLLMWMLAYMSSWSHNDIYVQVIDYVGFESHFQNTMKGVLNTKDLYYVFIQTLTPLYLAVVVLSWEKTARSQS